MTAAVLDVSVVDYHTAGEPFRIVTDGLTPIPGSSVLERREYAMHDPGVDQVRQLLVNEPRGHADMYGGFIVPADDDGAHFGVLFWHKDGYSTACGHGTIALGVWAVESGVVESVADGVTPVVIDVPSGRVRADVRCVAGQVASVSFRNVGSYAVARGVPVETRRGMLTADLSYGGAVYASVRADQAGLAVEPRYYAELIDLGRQVKWALNESDWARQVDDPRLAGVYGTILFDDQGDDEHGPCQRNVTVFADGEVDRSPCGSGTSARLVLLADDNRIAVGSGRLRHTSIIGTEFSGRVVERVGERVITEVEGMAYRTGTSTFTLDPRDSLGTGFVLR